MFAKVIENTLGHEGYYANVSGDKGGETYRGISRRFHPDWIGWPIIDRAKESKGGRLPYNYQVPHPLLHGMVIDFYKAKFWDKIHLDQVRDVNLQSIIFDAFVNSGKNGIAILQRVLSTLGQNISVDGDMGPLTVKSVNAVNPIALFNAYKYAREVYYNAIAKGDNEKFLRGWLNRIRSFNYTTVGLSVTGLVLLGLAGFFL